MSIFATLHLSTLRARATTLASVALLSSFTFVASVALADALVNVQVRSEAGAPVDGVVVLRSRANAETTYQCTTAQGDCHIDNVPGGQYTATFTPTGGQSQAPRTVMIPPAGIVSLLVAAR
jgi:hypothetical protein